MKNEKTFLRSLVLVAGISFLVGAIGISQSFGQVTALPADLTISFKGPSTTSQGEDISGKIKISVKNKGGLEAKNFHVDIILKGWAGTTPPPATEHMCGRGFIASLRPGDSISSLSAMGLSVRIPPDIPPGNYELCAIVDPTNAVTESKENNNSLCQKIKITERILKPVLPQKIPKEPMK